MALFDLISVDSYAELANKDSLGLRRVRANIRCRNVFSVYVMDPTGDLDVAARTLAEALWVQEDRHTGLAHLMTLSPEIFLERTTLMYIIKTLTTNWEGATEVQMNWLSSWVGRCAESLSTELHISGCSRMTRESLDQVRPFIDMCRQKGYYEVAVYVATNVLDWDIVRDVVRLGPGDREDEEYSSRLLFFLRNKAAWTIIKDIFSCHFGDGKLSCLRFCGHIFRPDELMNLAERCRHDGLEAWAMVFYMDMQEWTSFHNCLRSCSDPDAIDVVLMVALDKVHWQLVEHLLPRCSSDKLVLLKVFLGAVKYAKMDIVRDLLPRVDLQDLHRVVDNPVHFLLDSAVSQFSVDHAEQLTLLLIKAGLSTHLEHGAADLFRDTFTRKRIRLSKVLYKSGFVSLADCRQALQSSEVRDLMTNDPDFAQAVKDMLGYVQRKAVRTLEDLCRLKVSHLLGFHGCRDRSIKALETTKPVMNLLQFGDL